MADIPLAPIKRIMKKAGATRISDEAIEYLADHLVDQASIISENAISMAEHAGRKTIRLNDIELSIKTLYD